MLRAFILITHYHSLPTNYLFKRWSKLRSNVTSAFDGSSHSQQGLLTPTAQRSACETWNAHPFYWGRCLRPKFHESGIIPCQNVDIVR